MRIGFRSRAATPALALALASGTAWAASGRVSGQVTQPDGRPIEGVEVACGEALAHTDAGGLYALEDVEAGGRVVVSFAKAGHATTYGAVAVPAAEDSDGDGVPDARDRCPASDLRPTVTIDGCDTGLGNGIRKGCSAMDVFLDCSEHVCKAWHLLGCLASPRFLRRVEGLTWKTLKRAIFCVREATLPLEELTERPALPSASATLHATLLPATVEVLDPAADSRIAKDGFAAEFPAGSMDADGAVEVEAGLAPLLVPGPALPALPGDGRAIDTSLLDVLIEPWGALQVTLTQAGEPVSMVAPETHPVSLEFAIADSRLGPDDNLGLWSFDPTSGLWKEQMSENAVVSKAPGGGLVAIGSVGQPGWWTVAHSATAACVEGQVEDALGTPVAGALVTAADLDRHTVTAARSGDDGSYCVPTRPDSRVSARASAVVDGLRLDSAPAGAATPLAAAPCGTGGCSAGPTLVLPKVSCVSGRTLDGSGQPRPGVTVVTSAGSSAPSDAEGRFCLRAPAGQRVTVFGEGYPPLPVDTGGAAACPQGCTEVHLVPPPPPSP
jgi:hypothetical protein